MKLSAADFLSVCSRLDLEWISFCHGYVQGIYDGMVLGVCMPAGTTRATIVGAVVNQLTAMPDLKSVTAASAVYAVLPKTFPCRWPKTRFRTFGTGNGRPLRFSAA